MLTNVLETVPAEDLLAPGKAKQVRPALRDCAGCQFAFWGSVRLIVCRAWVALQPCTIHDLDCLARECG